MFFFVADKLQMEAVALHDEKLRADVCIIHKLHCILKKNTHSRFLLYLCGKCLDFHKVFEEYLRGNKNSTGGKVKYSLPRVTHADVIFLCL